VFPSYKPPVGVSESTPVGQENNYIIHYFSELIKVSINANSYHTTVPAAIINQFNLKEGDQLEWTLKAENGELIVIVKPEKSK